MSCYPLESRCTIHWCTSSRFWTWIPFYHSTILQSPMKSNQRGCLWFISSFTGGSKTSQDLHIGKGRQLPQRTPRGFPPWQGVHLTQQQNVGRLRSRESSFLCSCLCIYVCIYIYIYYDYYWHILVRRMYIVDIYIYIIIKKKYMYIYIHIRLMLVMQIGLGFLFVHAE